MLVNFNCIHQPHETVVTIALLKAVGLSNLYIIFVDSNAAMIRARKALQDKIQSFELE